MFRVVTFAREYGSGGGRIAQMVAARLGWKLLDRCLVEKIAETARIDPRVAEKFDERPDPWFDRLAEVFWKSPGLRGYMAGQVPSRFDGEVAAHMTQRIIEEAAEIGDCVIVGRGSQCILQQREDVFHVFVYAPRGQRLSRLLHRDAHLSKAEAEKKLDAEDASPRGLRPGSLPRRLAESPSVSTDDFLVSGRKRGGLHYSFRPPRCPGPSGLTRW